MPRWDRRLLTSAALALLAGAAIPLAEYVVPPRYAYMDQAEALRIWQASPLAGGLDVQTFLQQPGARMYWGRALYPSFHPAGQGLPSNEPGAFTPQPFGRLAFRLLTPELHDHVALPLQRPPAAFPHAADVLVLTCPAEGYQRAAAVLFLDGSAPGLLAAGAEPFTCQ